MVASCLVIVRHVRHFPLRRPDDVDLDDVDSARQVVPRERVPLPLVPVGRRGAPMRSERPMYLAGSQLDLVRWMPALAKQSWGTGRSRPPGASFRIEAAKPSSRTRPCGSDLLVDGPLKPQRHVVRRACRPRGRGDVHFAGHRRGELPNSAPFRVIVIFYREWREGDGLATLFAIRERASGPPAVSGCDRCRAWPIGRSFCGLCAVVRRVGSARSRAPRSSQRPSTDSPSSGVTGEFDPDLELVNR
jgi:hypothetical protein